MTTNPNNPGPAPEPGDVVWTLEERPPSPEMGARLRQLLLDGRVTTLGDYRTRQEKLRAGLQYPTHEQWEAAQRGEFEPPYVIRVQRRDGAATLGVLRDRGHDEAAVYDADDLAVRLAAAADHPELVISYRAGGSDDWIVMEPGTGCDHYFPFPEEIGLDAEAMPGGAERGDCACGARWHP